MPFADLTQDQLQALSAGAAYLAAYLLASIGAWQAMRRLRAHHTPLSVGLRHWTHWQSLARFAGLLLSVGYPYAMVLTAAFSAGDVGLTPLDWPTALPWAVTLVVGGAVWIGLLWGSHRRRTGTTGPGRPWLAIVIDSLTSEGTAAIARGALIPLVGTYWGIWLAPVVKMLAARANPYVRARLRQVGEREALFLGGALDWFAAVVFAFGAGIWGALAARLLGALAARAAMRLAARRLPTAPSEEASPAA